MPSWRDAALVNPDDCVDWQPAELPTPALSRHTPRPSGVEAPNRPVLFEVSRELGVPGSVTAAARQNAESAGYAQGWAAGQRAARTASDAALHELRQRATDETSAAHAAVQRALATLAAAAHGFEQRCAPVVEELQDVIVSSAYDLAEAIVGAVVRDDEARGSLAVARALALVPDHTAVTVSVHPDDLGIIESGTVQPASVTLVADERLEPGDAVAATATGFVDARVSTALQRVQKALTR